MCSVVVCCSLYLVTFYISLLLMYWQTSVDDNHMVFASISPPSKVVKRSVHPSIASAIGFFFHRLVWSIIGEDLHVYKGRPR